MGLLSWLGFDTVNSLGAVNNVSRGVVSPWAGPNTLQKVVINDLFGLNITTVTRAEAMSIPAVARARHLICDTLGRQPLKQYRDGVEVEDQPTWLYRTDSAVSPRMRNMWLLDDAFFYGWALMAVTRGADGQILDGLRVPKARWKFDSDGRVLVDDNPVSSEQVVLIPGLSDGLLVEAARTIRAARLLEEQWVSRVKNPVPVTEIRYTGEEDLTPEEMKEIRDSYINARNDENGTVMVTPRGFEVHAHGDQALELHIQGRNAVSLDIARFANLPALLLDSSNVNASSVNYQNSDVKRNEFHDLSLRAWALPLEERFSMDDVTPRGTYIAFDLSALTTVPDTGAPIALED